jgi:DNA-binding transcriptional regulator YiaG
LHLRTLDKLWVGLHGAAMLHKGRPKGTRAALKDGALRRARLQMRLTQDELARRISVITGAKVRAHNIYEWEKGNARPPAFALQAACLVLNLDADKVVTRAW